MVHKTFAIYVVSNFLQKVTNPMEAERLARARRVQLLRDMSQLSRREFAEKTGIPHSTMQHWEDGNVHSLPEKSINRLITGLAAIGIHCSFDWLLHGAGEPPLVIDKWAITGQVMTEEAKHSEATQKNQIKQIQAETEVFLKQHKHAVDFVVNDDAMEPIYKKGEVVAGIRRYGKAIENLIGQDCIVLIQGGESYLRRLMAGSLAGCYHLSHINLATTARKPFFYDVKLVSAAPVVWLRRIHN